MGAGALDCEGDYLIPGLVELHTDHLERELTPRKGVEWPALSALLSHDAKLASCGITTVLDAVAIGDTFGKRERSGLLERAVGAVEEARGGGMLRADHFLHIRCEVATSNMMALYDRFGRPRPRQARVADGSHARRAAICGRRAVP